MYKKLLAQKGVTSVSQIISYKTLRKEYKPFEAKRRLLNRFDLFLSDDRIRRLLPSHLGKHFYRSKNTARIGHTGMKADEILENVIAAAEVIAKKLPKNWKNVKILHLKTVKSVALPIFTAQISNLDELDKEPSVDKQEEEKKKKRREKKPKKAGKKMTSGEVAVTTEINATAANQEPEMKEKAEVVQEPDDDDDGEIPQLVPIQKTTSIAELKKMEPSQSPEKGDKLGKKTKTRLGKRKTSLPQETPKTKHKVTEERADLQISPKQKQVKQFSMPKEAIKEKELKKTPRKPEAKSFATPKAGKLVQSAKKSSKTPK
uniref:Ribosomal L1 domain containing 1 n=1 Tax=Apteryx owenii TaxID=8824 RepID=A0A8B9S3V4_APTOW